MPAFNSPSKSHHDDVARSNNTLKSVCGKSSPAVPAATGVSANAMAIANRKRSPAPLFAMWLTNGV